MFLSSLNKAWQLCGTELLHPPRRPVTAAEQVSRIKGTLCRLPRRHKMWIFFVLLHLWQWGIYNSSFKDKTISRSYKYLNFSHSVTVSDKFRKTNPPPKANMVDYLPMATKEHATNQGFIFKGQAWPLKTKALRSLKHRAPLTQWNSTTSQKTWTESSVHQSLPNCV